MSGYSPILPLVLDAIDGPYASNKTVKDTIKQNLKMLLLTTPGERIMNPDFGVGIKAALFQQNTEDLRQRINDRIMSQVDKYMNYVRILNLQIINDETSENTLYLLIKYQIPSVGSVDELIIGTNSI
jgi:phage baseplate assembly protein W